MQVRLFSHCQDGISCVLIPIYIQFLTSTAIPYQSHVPKSSQPFEYLPPLACSSGAVGFNTGNGGKLSNSSASLAKLSSLLLSFSPLPVLNSVRRTPCTAVVRHLSLLHTSPRALPSYLSSHVLNDLCLKLTHFVLWSHFTFNHVTDVSLISHHLTLAALFYTLILQVK